MGNMTAGATAPAVTAPWGTWQSGQHASGAHRNVAEAHANTGGRPPAMNIVVCVKQVPDTATERKLRSEDNTLDRDAVDGVVNELDEYAVEEALKLKEAHGGEVTVLTMGP